MLRAGSPPSPSSGIEGQGIEEQGNLFGRTLVSETQVRPCALEHVYTSAACDLHRLRSPAAQHGIVRDRAGASATMHIASRLGFRRPASTEPRHVTRYRHFCIVRRSRCSGGPPVQWHRRRMRRSATAHSQIVATISGRRCCHRAFDAQTACAADNMAAEVTSSADTVGGKPAARSRLPRRR